MSSRPPRSAPRSSPASAPACGRTDQVRKTWREQRRFKPTADRARITEHLARWDVAVAKA